MQSSSEQQKERLAELCLTALLDAGSLAPGLRELAVSAGTSARMLIYHFGSRDGLERAVLTLLEKRLRAGFERSLARGADAERPTTLASAIIDLWDSLSATEMRPLLALSMDAIARAAQGELAATAFVMREVAEWKRLIQSAGCSEPLAMAIVNVFVGSGFHLLTTGDRDAGRTALEAMLER